MDRSPHLGWWRLAVAVAFVSMLACTGIIAEPSGSGEGDGPPPEVGSGGPRCVEGESPPPVPSSQTVRLTRDQYEDTVRSLLRLEDFDADGEFVLDGAATPEELKVDGRLAQDYRRVGEELASRVASDPTRLARIVPCDPGADEGCAERFVERFGLRAFRRPLEEDERNRYIALFQRAPELYEDGDPFSRGVELVVQTVLQSPSFLYRVERSEPPSEGAATPLDDFELASRLSYMLWDSMPDAELLEAAAAGTLGSDAELAAQAERMLADPRAEQMVADFHAKLMDAEGFEDLNREGWHEGLASSMKGEVEAFVRHVVFERDGGLPELLTAPYTFVNADLAPLYGLEGDFSSEFQRVETDPARRIGLLTQIGFLASNASYDNTDPIHRGLWIHRKLLCTEFGAAPDGAAAALGPLVTTKRAQIEDGTMQEGTACAGCHTTINPPGFALENYGPLGKYREQDNGYSVDSSTQMSVDGERVDLAGARDLAQAVAGSESVARCYASHWLRFAYGRETQEADECTVVQLGDGLRDGELSIRDLLVALVQTQAFRTRADYPE